MGGLPPGSGNATTGAKVYSETARSVMATSSKAIRKGHRRRQADRRPRLAVTKSSVKKMSRVIGRYATTSRFDGRQADDAAS